MRVVFLIHCLVSLVVRLYFGLHYRKASRIRYRSLFDVSFLFVNSALLSLAIFSLAYILDAVFMQSGSFGGNPRLGALGALLLALHVILLFLSHQALGAMWSGFVCLKENHRLVTHGIYRYCRHPMYLGCVFWVFGAILLTQNAYFLSGLLMFPGLLLRMRAENRLLTDHFGIAAVSRGTSSSRLPPSRAAAYNRVKRGK